MDEKSQEAHLGGDLQEAKTQVESRILEFLGYLKKQGKHVVTVTNYGYSLKRIAANTDIFNPESVKGFIAENEATPPKER